jgi:hypothetical protein
MHDLRENVLSALQIFTKFKWLKTITRRFRTPNFVEIGRRVYEIRHHFLYAFKWHTAFITSLFAKLIKKTEGLRVKIRHTESHQIPPRHLEITGRNLFTPPK